MTEIIYSNNDVKIELEIVDTCEAKININGENLMWILRNESEEFKIKLTELLNMYMI